MVGIVTRYYVENISPQDGDHLALAVRNIKFRGGKLREDIKGLKKDKSGKLEKLLVC